jgi:LacI family transcriptional regulator
LGIPIVLFNRHQYDDRLTSVTSDNVAGGRILGDFLIAGGHERIAHIAGWEGASTQIDREAGFVEALNARGRTLFARGVGNFDFEQAKDAAREMFGSRERPDAVFVANDHMAFAVMDVLRYELGLRVPEDVSVVGYDDVAIARWPSFDLTTVRQPANRMVAETTRALMARLSGQDDSPRRIVLEGPLMVRGSSRKPKEAAHERL